MLDFVNIVTEETKYGYKIYPEFIVKKSKDLMIRGRAFYAIWDDQNGLWSKNENDVQRMVDDLVMSAAENVPGKKEIKLLKNFSSNKWQEWKKYCNLMSDNYVELDPTIIFSNYVISKNNYSSKILNYPIEEMSTPAYDRLIGTLYNPKEKEKLEWAIGAVIAGDSKYIQKFIVIYGDSGTGKSTILNIIHDMFPHYCSYFEARGLTSLNDQFGLESLKDNPLIAIQQDGDLSRIEDNTKLNSIISHEEMVVNEKFRSKYTNTFRSFLFMGTNKPVKITDSKSGIVRRLIDVYPSNNLLPENEYDDLKNKIKFEYPGIAYRCLELYKKLGKDYYSGYIPVEMIGETNDIYSFIEDNYDLFSNEDEDGISLSVMWRRYKEYCEMALVPYPLSMRLFKVEMKNYFEEFFERYKNRYSVYKGFINKKFEKKEHDKERNIIETWLKFDQNTSLLDEVLKDCPAQYATKGTEIPLKGWDDISSTLKDIDTSRLHYVRPPINHIIIDFDLKNEKGEKDYNLNLKSASKWPETYAEISKGGNGIHLHYWYDGDVSDLAPLYDENVEIKVFSGKQALRRRVSKCNSCRVATISSGLPKKERSKSMISDKKIKSEQGLRNMITRNLKKEIHPNTKPSIDLIYKCLEDCYNSGIHYDVTDMFPYVQTFAMGSTNNASYCLGIVSKMKFKSEEPSENEEMYSDDSPIVFFDVEVFPNLFLVVWKKEGDDQELQYAVNPSADYMLNFIKMKLVGYNCRRYDNHICYAAAMGYSNEQLFKLSQRIIVEKDRDAFFGEAYNLSYTDIYDYSTDKKSLKMWEVELGLPHKELDIPWDQPVDESLWSIVKEYCGNDVISTEAVWNHTQSDFKAREILAGWAGMTVNDTTNSLTTRLIVGKDPKPQSKFIYTDLSTIFPGYEYCSFGIDRSRYKEGVKISTGKSIYLGKDPSEGGYAIGYPGIYRNAAVLDVESMHPHSAIKLRIFGEEYTLQFEHIVAARLYIKHKQYDKAKTILPEILHVYLEDASDAKGLAFALKIAINSVYGLTSASFENRLRDPNNIDNIVAKYGALFMITLEEEVTKRGYKVIHIKTDSIKIADADVEIIQFCKDFAKEYGFTFNHEATYERICLVNDAVYIAKYASIDQCRYLYGEDYSAPGDNLEEEEKWTATGAQFKVPYVFKTLFSKEELEFKDLCETRSVTTSMYLDFNEKLLNPDDHNYHFIGKVGLFCPVLSGNDGGILYRKGNDGKMSAVSGTKKDNGEAYRWMEADIVKSLDLVDQIDLSYYETLASKAKKEIEKYGNFDQFVSGVGTDWFKMPYGEEEELPFEEYERRLNAA